MFLRPVAPVSSVGDQQGNWLQRKMLFGVEQF